MKKRKFELTLKETKQFKIEEIRDLFLNNFKDLIKKTKNLI